jgi:hypothetical protein
MHCIVDVLSVWCNVLRVMWESVEMVVDIPLLVADSGSLSYTLRSNA